jgi:ribonuclease J
LVRKHQANEELVFLPLGGAGEIGMNMSLYGYGPADARQWIMIDCGVTFGGKLDTPGIDVVMPDPAFIVENRRDLLAIILTHAHEDHIGAVAHLWRELRCPIYATPFTASMLEPKLEEAGLLDELEIEIVQLGGKLSLGPFEIELITITHSIPEPNAIAVRTPLGNILHTGDWKIDPDPLIGEATDEAALRALGEEGVLAMVCDSTNALVDGESGSEATVRESLMHLIGTLKQRVAVTSFASNVARVESIILAARTHGREVALVGRAMNRIFDAARENGFLTHLPALVSADRLSAARQGPLYRHGKSGRARRRAHAHRQRRPSRSRARGG